MHWHQLDTETRQKLLAFFKKIKTLLPWDISDMLGIDPEVITHKLNIDLEFKPIKQRKRKFTYEKSQIINKEVERLKSNGLIRSKLACQFHGGKEKEQKAKSIYRPYGS